MRPSREEVKKAIKDAGWTGIYTHMTSPTTRESLTVPVEWDQIERFAVAMYEAGADAYRESMKGAGWRRCAKGQRTTQFCGQLEAAISAERAVSDRLLAKIKHVVGWLDEDETWGNIATDLHALISEVESMRKENKE